MWDYLWIGIAVTVIAVLGFLLTGRNEPKVEPAPEPADDPARALFAAAEGGEPPTEDQIAQARLGGTRGNPRLGAAPMVPQERKNTPHPIDDGHVA